MKRGKNQSALLLVARDLQSQARLLRDAGGDLEICKAYEDVALFLRSLPERRLNELIQSRPVLKISAPEVDVSSANFDELEALINDEGLPRKVLEKIAITRFHVPKGSMRGFQNVSRLREKIRMEIENARTHEAIERIASKSGR